MVIIREEKGTQTQTFGSVYPPVGWGFSTWRGGGRKVRYAPRNQGNHTLAGYPRILPGYPGGARKCWGKTFVFNSRPLPWPNNFRGFCAGKKKAYTALLECRTELCRKKWGPQRKDFGGGYGFPGFIGFLYPPPAWKVFLWGQKSSPKDFLSVVVVHAFFFSAVVLVVSSVKNEPPPNPFQHSDGGGVEEGGLHSGRKGVCG